LSGKPGNVKEFDSCQGNVRDFRELSGKSGLKLFIVSCMFASILDFAELERFILVGFRSCTVAFLPPPLTATLVPA